MNRENDDYKPRWATLLHEDGRKELVDLNEVMATPEYVAKRIEEALKNRGHC